MIKSISIIHASKNRPHQALQATLNWLKNASGKIPIEYILSLDKSDMEISKYLNLYSDNFNNYCPYEDFKINALVQDNTTAIEAINIAAKKSHNDLIIVISDDFRCFNNWDKFLIDNLSDEEDFVAKSSDGIEDWIITLPIMDRKYYNRFGYIYFPEYNHLFCDTELTHVADILDRKITLNITFPHLHYAKLGLQPDDIAKKNNATWEQGKMLYLQRIKKNFGLKEKGVLKYSQSHKNWLLENGILA